MNSENKREIITLLARSVAHLYALAGTLATPGEWETDTRATEIERVVEMLARGYSRLGELPECAASVLEQSTVVHALSRAELDDVQIAMALARSGLIINTWCTATTMLVSSRASEGPLTIGGLMRILGTLQPDARYQTALVEKLAGIAYDNSAVRQLGTCYFQAFEAYSLLELHRAIQIDDTSKAVDLFDNASRGAMTAVRFLERRAVDSDDAEDDHSEGVDEAEEIDATVSEVDRPVQDVESRPNESSPDREVSEALAIPEPAASEPGGQHRIEQA